jgi:thiamine pyrophosphate-dependent acetolactate synthase large subunit-like protein
VAALAERLAAPVVMTYAAKGLLPPSHPCAVPATLHYPEVGALWDDSDLVIAIGTDLDGLTTQNWALPNPARLLVINIDEEDGAKNYRPDVTLVGDAARVTELLSERIPQASDLGPTRERLDRVRGALREAIVADEPEALSFLDAMAELVPDGANVIVDMCIPGYWLAGFHLAARPRTFAYPMWGTLGFTLPASVGAAAGGDRTVCVCGDGGFLFARGELATLAQEGLPVTVIVTDDGGYGMLRFDQLEAGTQPFGVDLETPDFVALAKSFGLPVVGVRGFGESFRGRLSECLRGEGPNVLVVEARLRPPPNTSPRWYRRDRGERSQSDRKEEL